MKDFKPNYKDYSTRTKDGVAHSKHYHKYFDGYMEKRIETPKGKKRIERIYVEDYHKHMLSDKQWVALKVTYVAMLLVGLISFCCGSSMDVESNMTWYVSLPSFFVIFSMFLLIIFIVPYVFAPRLMTNWEYASTTGRVKKFSRISLYCMVLQIATLVVYFMINRKIEWREIFSMLCFVVSGTTVFAINRTEEHMKYITVKNSNVPEKVPEDSYIIR
jgi:uncharacterized integral membrane protein